MNIYFFKQYYNKAVIIILLLFSCFCLVSCIPQVDSESKIFTKTINFNTSSSQSTIKSFVVNLNRIKGLNDYPPFIIRIEAFDDNHSKITDLKIDTTYPQGIDLQLVNQQDGGYEYKVTPSSTGELDIIVKDITTGLTQEKTALVFKYVDENWGQPQAVPGDFVNTAGWEDGASISPDGEWLLIHYSPMSFSGYISQNPNNKFAKKAAGPWKAPERPDFFSSRISNEGTITNSFPLYNAYKLDMIIPPTSFYGFKRQNDGSFESPFVIGINDEGNGCLSAFGPTITSIKGNNALFLYSFTDPLTGNHSIYASAIKLGQKSIIGEYYRNHAKNSIERKNFTSSRLGLPVRPRAGNPHLYISNGQLDSLWIDNEEAKVKIIYFYKPMGTTLEDHWEGPIPLPYPINKKGSEQIQPFFDGKNLIYRQDDAIVSSLYLGGSYDDSSAWQEPKKVIYAEKDAAPGKIFSVGEPTTCIYKGEEYLYFVYIVYRKNKNIDLNVGFVKRKPTNRL